MFGWPLYSDVGVSYTPLLSGGSWSATLPLTNMQDRRLAKLARSTDALAASTQFDVDLGVARAVRVFALPKHGISSVGTIRLRSSNTAGNFATPGYDSTALAVWPSGVTAEDLVNLNLGYTLVLPSTAPTQRYWRIEIVDTTNPLGYIDIGRLVLAAGWQPSINLDYGVKLGVETATTREETDGGAAIFNEKPTRRTQDFGINTLPNSEAMVNVYRMQRLAGTSGQILFVFDPDDTAYMYMRSFLCVMRQLSAIESPYYASWGAAFQLVEEL